MRRETLNRIFSSRAFYIVFSLLVSIALWVYVEINDNQVRTWTVQNVPVVKLNEQVLSDRNLLITSMSPDNVSLTFECPRSTAAKLTKDTLSASIDLAGIYDRGSPALRYDIVYPQGFDVNSVRLVSRSIDRISLSIDRVTPKSIRVDVPYKGGAAEGYMTDPVVFSPQEITIQGPAEVVSRVSSARVNIVRENLATTYKDDLPFVLLDENGNELDQSLLSQLSYSDTLISVTVPVKMTKEVALTAELSYAAGATSQNTTVSYDPPSIVVAGDPEVLKDLNNIVLGTIDMTKFEYSDTQAFKIALPNNVTNISGETESRVTTEVLGLGMTYLSVGASNIHYINAPSGYTPEIRTQSVDVRIRGKQEDLENVSAANIRIVVDLTDLGSGTQRVPARIYVDGIDADVGAIGNYLITVTLTRE